VEPPALVKDVKEYEATTLLMKRASNTTLGSDNVVAAVVDFNEPPNDFSNEDPIDK
jgi:hypothetical protein